jgi:simple sugar transport system permease protein
MTTTQSTEVPTKAAIPPATSTAVRVQNAVIKYGFIFVTVALFAYFALSEGSFRESATLLDTLRYVSVAAILGLGVTLTMAVGGMDMSVGAVAGLGVSVAAHTMVVLNQVGAVAILAVIAAGALAGLLNALLIVVLKIPDMLATLGTMFVIQGTKLILVDGQSITPGMTLDDGTTAPGKFTDGFLRIDRGTVLGIPISVLIFGALTIAAWVFLARTRWGRVLYAIGANPEASRLAGIRVGAYRALAYVLSGVLASIGGLILASRIGHLATAGGGRGGPRRHLRPRPGPPQRLGHGPRRRPHRHHHHRPDHQGPAVLHPGRRRGRGPHPRPGLQLHPVQAPYRIRKFEEFVRWATASWRPTTSPATCASGGTGTTGPTSASARCRTAT